MIKREPASMALRKQLGNGSLAFIIALTSGCAGGLATDDNGVRGEASVNTGASYTLVRKGSGKCLDIAGGASADGTGVQQSSCTGGAGQTFRVDDLGGGNVRLVNPSSNKCVDVNGSGT